MGGSVGRKLPLLAPELNAILAYFTPADNPCVAHIVKRTAAETYVTRLAAETGVNILLEEIGTALARGEKVVIPGFGTFARTSRVARV